FQGEPEAAGAFGAVDGFDVAAAVIAFEGAAQAHDQGEGGSDTFTFTLVDGARVAVPAGEQMSDGFGEFLAHLFGAGADVVEGAEELLLARDRGQAGEQGAVAHSPEDGVMAIDHAGATEQHPELAIPNEFYAAASADVSGPMPVVDFAHGSQQRSACIALHRQDRAEVLENENAEPAELPQYPAPDCCVLF